MTLMILMKDIKKKLQEKAQKKASLNDAFMRDELTTLEYSRQMSALDLDQTTLNKLLNQ